MSKAAIAPEELLERATALARSEHNIEIMDRTAILHGYLELTRLDPNNTTYRKNVEDAAASLLKAAHDVIGALDWFVPGRPDFWSPTTASSE